MRHKTYLWIILGFALFTLALGAGYFVSNPLAQSGDEAAAKPFSQPAMPADILLDFSHDFGKVLAATEAQTLPQVPLAGPQGELVLIGDFRGEWLLVNFWATWCAPCVVELPSLKRFAQHYDGKIRVIGVSLDTSKTHAEILDFLKKRELGDFAGYFDPKGDLAAKLALRGIPTSFLIGKDGHILYRLEGDADWTSAQTRRFFDVFLNHSASPNR